MAFIGTNMNVKVQQTLGSAITVSAITAASPGVVTATAHGLTTGDIVVFAVAEGMVELDGQAARVTVSDADTFSIDNLDTSSYSTFTAGTCKEVSAFQTLGMAQSVTAPDPTPAKIDITRLIDKSKQYAYGLPDAPDGSISGLYDPNATAVGLIKAATKANTTLVFQVNWSDGAMTLFNANVSGGSGFDLAQNDAAKATISFTPVKDILTYAA